MSASANLINVIGVSAHKIFDTFVQEDEYDVHDRKGVKTGKKGLAYTVITQFTNGIIENKSFDREDLQYESYKESKIEECVRANLREQHIQNIGSFDENDGDVFAHAVYYDRHNTENTIEIVGIPITKGWNDKKPFIEVDDIIKAKEKVFNLFKEYGFNISKDDIKILTKATLSY
jgi:hypothetical protein